MGGNAHEVGPPRNHNTFVGIYEYLLALEAYRRLLQQEDTAHYRLPFEAAQHDG